MRQLQLSYSYKAYPHRRLYSCQSTTVFFIKTEIRESRDATCLRGFTKIYTASKRQLVTSTHHRRSASSNNWDSTTEQHSQTPLVRNLMRLVPHPVAIITSTEPLPSEHVSDKWRGATVSSFNTVTFTPEPIISFNIKRQSATFTAILKSKLFNVHLLNEGSEAERIAAKFASGNEGRPFHNEASMIEKFVRQSEDIGNEKTMKPPVIQGGGATTFRFLCEHLDDKTVDIGDHVVILGRVVEVEEFETSSAQPCLVYVDRKYGRVT